GVHGVPFVRWQNDPTEMKVKDHGYCTHRSVLFIPWHRPYMMLFEQIIYAYPKEIADKEPSYAGEAYREALADVRLPYWDWASNPHLPPATMSQDIVLTIPGDAVGKTKQKRLDHNPLYSYKFTSDYATDQMRSIMNQWPHTDKWRESKRCPDSEGNSHPEIADKQIGRFTDFKTKTFKAIMSAKDFGQFTCQAWRGKQQPETYASVEDMHNTVHNYTGTIDIESHNFISGNMTEVQASSFDPIFW
ncbi:Di-copper centre-containing protein, partial [Colletotrichum eremochloae]